jgi:hypothetical protein
LGYPGQALSDGPLGTTVSVHVKISQSLNPASSHLTTCQFSPSHPVFQSAIFDRAASFVQILCNVNDEGSEFFAYLYQPAYQKNCVLACPCSSSLIERHNALKKDARTSEKPKINR